MKASTAEVVDESNPSIGRRIGDPAMMEAALAAVSGSETAMEAFTSLRWWTRSEEAQAAEAFDVEEGIRVGGNEVMRLLLKDNFDIRGPGDVGPAVVLDDEGKRLGHRREHAWEYKSQFGPIPVVRLGYGAPGEASVHPLDESLNIPARHHSFPLQKRVARLSARGPFDEVVDEIAATTAVKVHKRQVEEIVEDSAVDFDAFYEEQANDLPPPSETGPILTTSIDCKGIPRRRTAEEKANPRPKHLGKGEKRQKKKMATVASVHTTQPHRRTPKQVVAALMDPGAPGAARKRKPTPEYRRLWASVKKSKSEVIQEVAAEMERRDPTQSKLAVCVMDGERALHTSAVKYLKEKFSRLILVLDIIHVLSYLWKASHVFNEEGSEEARLWVRERLLAILRGHVSQVVAGMRQSATKRGLSEEEREPVDIACNYFLKNKDRMRYNRYLRLGIPIASGSSEGACGHLVKDRMELTGASWDVEADRTDAVLKLRALDKSGDLEPYWTFHMKQEKWRRFSRKWTVSE
jgi:hypothetical protein